MIQSKRILQVLISAVMICLSSASFCQQDTAIHRLFGGIFEDELHSSLYDNDSNLVFCGRTSSIEDFGSKAFMVKTDTLLNEEWSLTYGDIGNAAFRDIVQKDEGYLLTGELLNPNSSYDIFLVHIDEDGNFLWDKNYGTSDWDFSHSIAKVTGGYIITGKTYGYSENADAYLLKVDDNGDLLWEKTFDDGGDEIFYDGRESLNGNYILGGTKIISEDLSTQWLVVTDSDGNVLVDTELGTENDNAIYSVESDPQEESYFALGEFYNSVNETTDANIIRFDETGTTLWVDTLLTLGTQKWQSMELGLYTELICTGFTVNGDFGDQGDDFLLKRITRDGGFIDQVTFGTPGNERANHAIRIDNGYILTGHTDGLGQGQNDGYVIRTRNNGQDPNYSVVESNIETSADATTISSVVDNSEYFFSAEDNTFYSTVTGNVTIYSIDGKLIDSFLMNTSSKTINLSTGTYLLVLEDRPALHISIK